MWTVSKVDCQNGGCPAPCRHDVAVGPQHAAVLWPACCASDGSARSNLRHAYKARSTTLRPLPLCALVHRPRLPVHMRTAHVWLVGEAGASPLQADATRLQVLDFAACVVSRTRSYWGRAGRGLLTCVTTCGVIGHTCTCTEGGGWRADSPVPLSPEDSRVQPCANEQRLSARGVRCWPMVIPFPPPAHSHRTVERNVDKWLAAAPPRRQPGGRRPTGYNWSGSVTAWRTIPAYRGGVIVPAGDGSQPPFTRERCARKMCMQRLWRCLETPSVCANTFVML